MLSAVSLFAQSKGGYWSFDNDPNDTADWDQINDSGQLFNDAHYSELDPVEGQNAYLCLDSIAAHDFFLINDSDDLDFDNENIGISAWLKPVVLNPNQVYFLINKGVQDANPKTTNYALRISKTKNLEFLIRDADNKAQVATSSITIAAGEWMFIAAYYDFIAKQVYFWDKPQAEPSDTVSFGFDYFSNSDPLTIGAWAVNDTAIQSNSDFEGSMDEVRISGRLNDIIPVLSSIEVERQLPVQAKGDQVSIFPNPAHVSGGSGHIEFQINAQRTVQLGYTIYNILGQKIYQGRTMPLTGSAKIPWRMRDNSGLLVNTGIYFVEFTGLSERIVRKILIVR